MKLLVGVMAVLMVLTLPSVVRADSVITFEGFADGTTLGNQYPELTFSNAIILTSGISLDEFEFPPHSGVNVVSDNGGPMTIKFATPVASFAGYFTYAEPVTVTAISSLDNQIASILSTFSNNEAISGIPGSSPNEFLSLSWANGISQVNITGDPFGGSFTLDDVSTVAVPEPSILVLLLTALGVFFTLRLLHNQT